MASYMLDKPKQMTRKQIYLNILMFIFLSVLFTKSIVSYESLQKLYVLKIGTNIHIFLEIFPSFEKELLKQLTQSVFTCSKLTIETLQQRCEICFGVVLVSLLLTMNIFHTFVLVLLLLTLNMLIAGWVIAPDGTTSIVKIVLE